MKMIFGLGNPGAEYAQSRHNAGFCALDKLADRLRIPMGTKQRNGVTGTGFVNGEKVMLIKPQTFMNRSGACVFGFAAYYKANATDLWVIYDDIDLPAGIVRVRTKGGAGTHNGMRDIVAKLGTEEFPRFRVGVGAPPQGWDLADYVLAKPREQDAVQFEQATARAAEAVETALRYGVEVAMRYNGAEPHPMK